ncbi:MAG TPA: urease accessory UreF family protein [Steroidobacteraceae bacterium]|jgi:urease accessory protein
MARVTAILTSIDSLALLRLFHLVSPALPVGAYAYSQGLEYAVQAGWVHDESSSFDWLQGLMSHAVGTLDLPILLRLQVACSDGDHAALQRWNAELIAARETAELRAEERHLGSALARVLIELAIPEAAAWQQRDAAFATLFGLAATRWGVSPTATLSGYAWSWCENQVLAAIKLVPLGQSAGQRLLHRLTHLLPQVVARALELPEDSIGTGGISQVLASSLHESQYSRLFRS